MSLKQNLLAFATHLGSVLKAHFNSDFAHGMSTIGRMILRGDATKGREALEIPNHQQLVVGADNDKLRLPIGLDGGADFKIQYIPRLSGVPNEGTYKGYLLLAKAFIEGYVVDSHVSGDITLNRGGLSTGARHEIIRVVSKSAYRGDYLNCFVLVGGARYVERTVKVKYNGTVYHAIETTTSGGFPANGIYFEGDSNVDIVYVDESQVTNIEPFGSMTVLDIDGSMRLDGPIVRKSLVDVRVSDEAYSAISVPAGNKWICIGKIFYLSNIEFTCRVCSQNSEENLTIRIQSSYFADDTAIEVMHQSYNSRVRHVAVTAYEDSTVRFVWINVEHDKNPIEIQRKASGTGFIELMGQVVDDGSQPTMVTLVSLNDVYGQYDQSIRTNAKLSVGKKLKFGNTPMEIASESVGVSSSIETRLISLQTDQAGFFLVNGDNGFEGFCDLVMVSFGQQPAIIGGSTLYGGTGLQHSYTFNGGLCLTQTNSGGRTLNVRVTSFLRL